MWSDSDLDDVEESQDAAQAVRFSGWLALALRASLMACASGRGTRPGAAAAAERTTLEVDNRGFADMTVYVIDGGQRVRLGVAAGNSKTVMTIPAHMVSGARSLQFLADPIGSSRTAVSDTIYVQPGDTVTLLIQR